MRLCSRVAVINQASLRGPPSALRTTTAVIEPITEHRVNTKRHWRDGVTPRDGVRGLVHRPWKNARPGKAHQEHSSSVQVEG